MKPHIKLKTKKALSVVPFKLKQEPKISEYIDYLKRENETDGIKAIFIAWVDHRGCSNNCSFTKGNTNEIIGEMESAKYRILKNTNES